MKKQIIQDIGEKITELWEDDIHMSLEAEEFYNKVINLLKKELKKSN
tara:strand:+ start:592 stop:732 length:141 start_codon:yes stop_codon:yes gene_type:complete